MTTKGGTDVLDYRMAKFYGKSKSQKWMRVAFPYLLGTTRVKASIIFGINSGLSEHDAFEIGWNLAELLVLPFVVKRQLLFFQQDTA